MCIRDRVFKMTKMNIKKGDRVKVLSGKDKGKEGVVLRSIPQKERVVVAKVNKMCIRDRRARSFASPAAASPRPSRRR